MLTRLSEYINSFSAQSRRSIHSVLSEVSAEKNEIGKLVNKLTSFSSATDYTPRVIRQMESVEREPILDMFRDIDLRVKTQFDICNSISLLGSSMNNVFGGELDKLEKDIQYLNAYVDNYSFISGEDDLYNSSFIENFDNESNSFINENSTMTIPDRDGTNFTNSMLASVDPVTGKLKFSSSYELSLSEISEEMIQSIEIDTNFSKEYISSDTGFQKLFTNSNTKSWKVSVKSPFVIRESILDSEKYVNFKNRSQPTPKCSSSS